MGEQKKTVFLIGWEIIEVVNYKMGDLELLKKLKALKKKHKNNEVSYYFDKK